MDLTILEDSLQVECMGKANITGQILATGLRENIKLILEMEEEHTTLVISSSKLGNGKVEYF